MLHWVKYNTISFTNILNDNWLASHSCSSLYYIAAVISVSEYNHNEPFVLGHNCTNRGGGQGVMPPRFDTSIGIRFLPYKSTLLSLCAPQTCLRSWMGVYTVFESFIYLNAQKLYLVNIVTLWELILLDQ